jgi:hypothetical protein
MPKPNPGKAVASSTSYQDHFKLKRDGTLSSSHYLMKCPIPDVRYPETIMEDGIMRKTIMKLLLPMLAALALLLGGLQPTFAANSNSRDTTTTMGESDKEATDGALAAGANGIKTDSSNKGNPDNTNCNDCGTSGPGNKSFLCVI